MAPKSGRRQVAVAPGRGGPGRPLQRLWEVGRTQGCPQGDYKPSTCPPSSRARPPKSCFLTCFSFGRAGIELGARGRHATRANRRAYACAFRRSWGCGVAEQGHDRAQRHFAGSTPKKRAKTPMLAPYLGASAKTPSTSASTSTAFSGTD